MSAISVQQLIPVYGYMKIASFSHKIKWEGRQATVLANEP